MKTFKIFIYFVGGGYTVIHCTEASLDDTCKNLAEGIMRSGVPKKTESGEYKIEAFESFNDLERTKRSSLIWFHQIAGFVVDHGERDGEFQRLQLEIARAQLEILKKSSKDLDKGDEWRGGE